MFFIFGERERDGEKEKEKRGLILSIFFSRFGVIKKKKQEEGRRKQKIKVWKNQTLTLFLFL